MDLPKKEDMFNLVEMHNLYLLSILIKIFIIVDVQ